MRNLQPLTAKPVLYLANVGRGRRAGAAGRAGGSRRARAGARAAAVSARLEAELAELDEEEAAAMREELGAGESGLATVVREAWELLGLISFFTAGEGKEGRAWAIPRGHPRPPRRRAGSTPTSRRGFVAAEVVRWNDLVETRRLRRRARAGQAAVEGRDYAMRDGDVMTVRFTP